jgi:hypothetical protein
MSDLTASSAAFSNALDQAKHAAIAAKKGRRQKHQ